nr:hypothetical protein [Tanacetum cinerariifolium]
MRRSWSLRNWLNVYAAKEMSGLVMGVFGSVDVTGAGDKGGVFRIGKEDDVVVSAEDGEVLGQKERCWKDKVCERVIEKIAFLVLRVANENSRNGFEGCPNLACYIDDLVVLVRMVGEGKELVLDVEGFRRMYKPSQRVPWVVIPSWP